MKIKLTQGCTCDSFTADGKNINELPDELLLAMLSRIARTISFNWRECKLEDWRRFELIHLLSAMVENFPNVEEHSSEPCECCGDVIDTYKMDI